MNKVEKIKQSLRDTQQRRLHQICKVYEIKFDLSHLSSEKIEYLNRLFIEAKWLYNNQLASNDIFQFSCKTKTVFVKDKEGSIVQRDIKCLSSQMIQGIVERTKQNIINLSKAKKRGLKVGNLKYKSYVNSIPLTQFNNTYRIENDSYIKLQGFKKHFKVIGLSQIPKDAEIANAFLVRRNRNYYLKITCFVEKQQKIKTGKVIGLDFGIKDSIVDSDCNKYNFSFPESKQLKKLSKQLNKSQKNSKNRYKLKIRLKKQYEKLTNKKKDAKNKFVSKLTKEYDIICIQDEMIHQWHKSRLKGFGRKIQYGVSGGIISDLKKKSETVLVPRNFPSTQLCPVCGLLNKHGLELRTYSCSCGYQEDRDVHSAKNILNEGLLISTERRNTMLSEKKPLLNNLLIVRKVSSMTKEAI